MMWKYYAVLSALFAALTAIFAKSGVNDINLTSPRLFARQSSYC